MKLIKFCLVIVLGFAFSKGKSQGLDENKMLKSVLYLKCNKQINNEIKNKINKIVKLNSQYLDFNLSSDITFLDIHEFRDSLNENSINIAKEIITSDSAYYKKFYFKPEKIAFFECLGEEKKAKLFLSFSKPIGNILIGELINFENGTLLRKFGRGVKLAFVFDEKDCIKKVFLSTISYY